MFNNVLKNTMYANTLLLGKLYMNDREYSFGRGYIALIYI